MTARDDGASIEPDAVVRTALRLLPVPAHDDDFWRRLEVALDAEPPHVAPAEPVRRVLLADGADLPVFEPDRGLAVVPPGFRRASNAVLALVAAAAIVVVAIAANTLVDERNGTSVREPEPDAALETLVRNAQANGTVTTLSEKREGDASEAVLAWVDDVGSGDADGAWGAMGAASQTHFGSPAAFKGAMHDLAEGYRGWSSAKPGDLQVTPVASGDDGTVAVVTLVGTDEGASQPRAEAFPVRIQDGEVVLEPFASAGALEVVIPEPASDDGLSWETVANDEALVFVLPGDAQAPVLQIDGGDTVVCGKAEGTKLSDLDQSSGQRCAYLPEGGFAAGPHTVTIAFLGSGGDSITAESIRFDAA